MKTTLLLIGHLRTYLEVEVDFSFLGWIGLNHALLRHEGGGGDER